MSLTIDLAPELESEVRQSAKEAGIAPDRYVAHLVEQHLLQRSASSPPSEATLLKQVNLGLPPPFWQQYHQLRAKLEAERLTAEEQQALVALTDQIEAANVRRIQALIQLAKVRNTTLDALMDELGVRSPAYG